MSTFEQAMRDPCVALPQQRLIITAAQTKMSVVNGLPGHINPRECDHIYAPLDTETVCCSICGWWWNVEEEVMPK